MLKSLIAAAALPLLSLLLTPGVVPASEPTTVETTITIEGMHCQGCAKKVASRLKAVAGVQEVRIDAESGLAVVVPLADATVSPRALWEAVQKSRYSPVRLEGPSGTFTRKPRT